MMFLPISLMVGGIVFVPLLIIAIVRFKSVAVAFALAASFSIGATLGLLASLFLGDALLSKLQGAEVRLFLLFAFASAGSIGGASIALWLLRRLAGNQSWEQR
jgi:hypothetical protein